MWPMILILLALFHIESAADATPRSPFLSTTLSTKITSVSSDADFDSDRKITFSETLAAFLTKIFHDQQVYHVKVISVTIFDDHILKDGNAVEQRHSKKNEDGQYELSFSTVVAAEYTSVEDIDSIPKDSFRKMLVHVCDKFQDHLIKFMQESGDPYFMGVERVVLDDFERVHGQPKGDTDAGASNQVLGISNETLNTASIVAIVVGSILFLVLMFASLRYYRKEKQLKAYRLASKEMSSFRSPTLSSTTSSAMAHARHPMVDDYSFNPSGASPVAGDGYTGNVPPYTDYRDDPIHNNPSINEEEVAFSSVWPDSAPPARASPPATLFPAPGATTVEKATLSYTEELNKLPRQHIFAPPGKIGVAIDVVNGQPVVHKVRKHSPVENLLRPNDVIVAIDDEDASCMSAADVTSMMARRMDRVRKITFIRRG